MYSTYKSVGNCQWTCDKKRNYDIPCQQHTVNRLGDSMF